MPNLGDDKRPSDGDKPSTREKVTENLAEADSVETRNLPGSLIVVNASGHVQELDKNFNLASLIAVGITIGNVWPAAAGSVSVALNNGGSPGVIFEFLAACIGYVPITASLAEMASAIPSSSGIYQWATIIGGPKWGRPMGFFAGYWNYFQWLVGSAAMANMTAIQVLGGWGLTHPAYEQKAWHVYVVYQLALWSAYMFVLFGNRFLPLLNYIGAFFVLGGFIVMVTILSAMPGHGGREPHAESHAVWLNWENYTGWPDGFAFLCGMLNGAFAIGTPDISAHLAEEIVKPGRNVPRAMAVQMTAGTITGLAFLIAAMYCVSDFDALRTASVTLVELYHQTTRSTAGTLGLLSMTIMPIYTCLISAILVANRQIWILGRDHATPFPSFIAKVHEKHRNPFNAGVFNLLLSTVLGHLILASSAAFNAFISAYVQLSMAAYITPIILLLLGGRKYFSPGWFAMRGRVGFVLNLLAVAFMGLFLVIFSFPGTNPTTLYGMNWSSVVLVGLSTFTALWWFKVRKTYSGPVYVRT